MTTLRKRALSTIDTTTTRESKANPEAGDHREEEPVSPTGRLFREPHFNCYIVCVIGLGAPVDLPATRAGVAATLARHPRFCSVQVSGELDEGAKPKWVRTTVNLDDHIIVPELDPAAKLADPDKALEDYVSSLSTRPMGHSRPLWELHVLDFPTSESAAAAAFRIHHSLGDGVSLLSLFMACTRSAADPDALPSLPAAGRTRSGPLYSLPARPCRGVLAALALWVLSFLVLAWHTVVDVARLFATAASLVGDARTVLKGAEGTEFRPRRFVNHTLSLDDVKYVKNAMSCTVNDVLLGITSAGLSRYYFRRTGESERNNITVRSALMVNLRTTPGLHKLASMMESGKDNAARWGNQFGYMMIPFHLAKHDDPIEYVRKAKKVARRKKSSMESVFSYWSADMIVKLFGIKAAAALCYGMFTHTTLSFSNMVGPTEQIVFCGNPIVYIAPSTYGHPHHGTWRGPYMIWSKMVPMIRSWRILCPALKLEAFDGLLLKLEQMARMPERIMMSSSQLTSQGATQQEYRHMRREATDGCASAHPATDQSKNDLLPGSKAEFKQCNRGRWGARLQFFCLKF